MIATVTFAAGFTMPGGAYGPDENDPHKGGMAILANKTLFQMIFICNTIATYSSTAGCIILLWASASDYYTASLSSSYGFKMVGVALVTTSLAFMAATCLVVSNISWFANLITIIATIFFFLFLVIIILMEFPMGSCKPGLRPLSIIVLGLILWFHESHDLNRKDKVMPENLAEDKDKEKHENLDKDKNKQKGERCYSRVLT